MQAPRRSRSLVLLIALLALAACSAPPNPDAAPPNPGGGWYMHGELLSTELPDWFPK